MGIKASLSMNNIRNLLAACALDSREYNIKLVKEKNKTYYLVEHKIHKDRFTHICASDTLCANGTVCIRSCWLEKLSYL